MILRSSATDMNVNHSLRRASRRIVMTETLEIKESIRFHKPDLHSWNENGIYYFLDGSGPNWIAADDRGAQILGWIDGRRPFGEIIKLYSKTFAADSAKSWLHCHTFVKDALKAGIISPEPIQKNSYLGRSRYLKPERLKEFWIHLTQTCNLTCSHCLVSSGPKGEKGLRAEFYERAIDETAAL